MTQVINLKNLNPKLLRNFDETVVFKTGFGASSNKTTDIYLKEFLGRVLTIVNLKGGHDFHFWGLQLFLKFMLSIFSRGCDPASSLCPLLAQVITDFHCELKGRLGRQDFILLS